MATRLPALTALGRLFFDRISAAAHRPVEAVIQLWAGSLEGQVWQHDYPGIPDLGAWAVSARLADVGDGIRVIAVPGWGASKYGAGSVQLDIAFERAGQLYATLRGALCGASDGWLPRGDDAPPPYERRRDECDRRAISDPLDVGFDPTL